MPSFTDISICTIVKNEAEGIKPFIEHHKDLASQFIVADTGSEDTTKAMAAKAGAEVYDFEWTDSFAEARNFSIAKAACPWMLVLDPDERIAQSDFDTIREFLSTTNGDAVRLPYRIYYQHFCGQIGWTDNEGGYISENDYPGYIEMPKIRLIRNGRGYEFRGAVHELLEYSLKEKGAVVQNCPIPVHHCAAERTPEQKAKRNAFYLRLLKKKLQENIDPAKTHFEIGLSLYEQKRFDESIQHLEKAWKGGLVQPHLVCLISNVYRNLARTDKLYTFLEHAREKLPKDTYVLSEYAKQLFDTGRFDESLIFFLKSASCSPLRAELWNNIGSCYIRLGKLNDAADAYIKAVRINPGFTAALENVRGFIDYLSHHPRSIPDAGLLIDKLSSLPSYPPIRASTD